jgi:hypothetical protein
VDGGRLVTDKQVRRLFVLVKTERRAVSCPVPCQPVTEADAETPNALDPPNTGSELRAEQARVSAFVGDSASRREPQV